MSIGTIIALIRDAVIVGGIAYSLWFIHRADQNAVKLADLQAVMDQIDHNAQTEEKFREEARNAEAQRLVDMQTVTAAVAAQRAPVIVRVPTGGGSVSGHSGASPGSAACAGGNDTQAGGDTLRNVRPGINAFELEVEGYLATCRAVLESWPTSSSR